MSGNPKAKPWKFVKLRTRLVVRDANGDGPLFIIEGGYNAEAVAAMEWAVNFERKRDAQVSGVEGP